MKTGHLFLLAFMATLLLGTSGCVSIHREDPAVPSQTTTIDRSGKTPVTTTVQRNPA